MTDAEYKVLCDLRSIPQRNNNWYVLRGEQADTARELVKQGLVVANVPPYGQSEFRLNKPGRQALIIEWLRRGSPDPAGMRTN